KRSSSERSDSDSESLADSGAWHDDSRHRPQKRRAGVQSADEFIRVQQRKAERRQQKQRHLTILERYYSQPTYHGQSSAVCLFQLVEKLGRPPTFDTIWWAIVGVTSQLWLDRIDEDGYELVASSMSDTVSRVCLVATNTRSTSSTSKGTGTPHGGARPTRPAIDSAPRPTADIASISDYFADIEANGESLHHQQQQQRMTSSKDVRQVTGIYPSREFRFTLLRHWSLHSAMSYSPFVVTRLASWSTRGRSKFDLLMAKLGLSQTEIRQPFAHLDPRLKRQLDEQFEEVAKDFDLADAMYPSFVRDFGWRKAKVSASDAVLALVSLLSTTGARESNRTLGDRESGMQIQIDEQADKDTERKRWLDGFYAAYDALSDFNALEDGIRSAMRLQRAIIEQGTSILERRAIKTLRAFRLAVITEVDGPHLSLFRHPLTLLQLAQFLMSALREQGKIEHAALPFVIAALNTSTDTYIVLGITPPEYTVKRPRHGQTTSLYAGQVRNHFGLIFEETATKMNIQIKQGRFDTSVIEVHRNDLANFADRLRRHL
ncbi:DNA replication initiation factor cdc45, partial [Spiromyces aspiralis]